MDALNFAYSSVIAALRLENKARNMDEETFSCVGKWSSTDFEFKVGCTFRNSYILNMYTVVLGGSIWGKFKEKSLLDGAELACGIFGDLLTATVTEEGALIVNFGGSGEAGGMDMQVTVLNRIKN